MSNLSYCRFENTVGDLNDCSNHIYDELEKGGHEDRARARLIKISFGIVEKFIVVDEEGNISLDEEAIAQLPVEDYDD